jgi:ribose transport system permease protein
MSDTHTGSAPGHDDADDTAAKRGESLSAVLKNWRQYVIFAGFIVVFLVFAVTLEDRGFLGTNNLLNIVRQTATISVMAVGMTYVLATGQIDLSIGSIAGLASVTTAMGIAAFGLPAGILIGLATGLVVGMINGILTTKVGIPSFLVTLAMLGIARGTAMWITDTAAQPIRNSTYVFIFGSGDIGPLPVLLLWVLAVGLLGHVGLKRTAFGRQVLATGGNETAARFSGVAVRSIQFRVLTLSGLAGALGGMLYAGRLHSGRFQLGEGDELSVIAAVVLGGTSLFGGMGTVIGSIMGALMIGLINNGLILMGLDFSQQLIARGVIIVLAVAASRDPNR